MISKKPTRKISEKDIKLLYGRSAARCNLCKIPLFEPRPDRDGFIHLGQMAHQVAFSDAKEAPRFIDEKSFDNSYDNLILVCANDHIRIDQDTYTYTVDYLKSIKVNFENQIDRLFDSINKKNPRDEDLIKVIFTAGELQSIYNAVSGAGYTIHSDIFNLGIIRDMLENNRPVTYPFKDYRLQRATDDLFTSYDLLMSNLLLESRFKYHTGTHEFRLNESYRYVHLEEKNCRKQAHNLRKKLTSWIEYCENNYDTYF